MESFARCVLKVRFSARNNKQEVVMSRTRA
ncbi:hypothetical protein PHDIMM138B_16030 [Phytobacter diazotrophicus]